MVDGETSVMMVMKISSKSPSRQGARTEFLVSNRDFWWRWRSGSLSGENTQPSLFLGQRVYVGGRRGRGDGRGGLTTGGRGQGWAAPLVVSPGRSPPSSLLLAPWVFWQNRIFAVFSRIFPESRISAQKRDTRARLVNPLWFIRLVGLLCIMVLLGSSVCGYSRLSGFEVACFRFVVLWICCNGFCPVFH
jgi:hypothetical protein